MVGRGAGRKYVTRMEFWHIPYSPWSEKARWALDHHGIQRTSHEYVAMLSEPWLRWRARRWGRVTVPLLLDGQTVLPDSTAIARHADRVGEGAPLFPRESELAMTEWLVRSEEGLDAGRVLVTERVRRDAVALGASVPLPLPGRAKRWVGSVGVRFLERKYRFDESMVEDARHRLRGVLEQLAEAIEGRDHLLGGFSYADIAMAVVLQFVAPVDAPSMPLPLPARSAWRDDALALEFRSLLSWRDAMYARHRPAGVGAPVLAGA